MNRTIILLLALIVVVGVAIGVTLYLKSTATSATSPAQNQQGTNPVTLPSVPASQIEANGNSKELVQSTYKTIIASNTDQIKLFDTVISGGYAVQVWQGNTTGGEALLKYNTVKAKWVLMTSNGGVWTLRALTDEGVPLSTAQVLYASIPH